VEVSWQALREANPAVQPWPLAVYEGRTRLPAQSVDLDGDGTIDQLLFQVQVRPHEVRKFVVRNTYGGSPTSPLTDARFVLPREDIGWESDRIAFRMYGPALASEVGNGFDVWTKRVHYPIVEKWYRANEGRTGGKDTYHEDRGEGADFFAVGRTLGAGSCALLDSGRLALPGVFSSYRIISPGPLRAIFRVTYLRGTFRGVPFREDKTVSIDAGSNLNRVEVVYSGIASGKRVGGAVGSHDG
jgi:pectinesterase